MIFSPIESNNQGLTLVRCDLIITVDFDQFYNCLLQTDAESFVKEIIGQTSGFTPRDMCALIADVGANLFHRCSDAVDKARPKDIDGSCSSEVMQDSDHWKVSPEVPVKEPLAKALERSKKRNAAALGAPKVHLVNQLSIIICHICFDQC